MNLKYLSESQVYETIRNGEFGKEIINSNKNTAVIMTQDWCHQWVAMYDWLKNSDDIPGLDVYHIVYNNASYYEEFMTFKEDIFGNREIPYIRYYIGGILVKESNFISKDAFLKAFLSE